MVTALPFLGPAEPVLARLNPGAGGWIAALARVSLPSGHASMECSERDPIMPG